MRAFQYLVVLGLGFMAGWYVPHFTETSASQEISFPAERGTKAALIMWESNGRQGVTAALPYEGIFRAWIPKDQKYHVQVYR